jgi:hypothetical protein
VGISGKEGALVILFGARRIMLERAAGLRSGEERAPELGVQDRKDNVGSWLLKVKCGLAAEEDNSASVVRAGSFLPHPGRSLKRRGKEAPARTGRRLMACGISDGVTAPERQHIVLSIEDPTSDSGCWFSGVDGCEADDCGVEVESCMFDGCVDARDSSDDTAV